MSVYARARKSLTDRETGSVAKEGDEIKSVTFFGEYNDMITLEDVWVDRIGHVATTFVKNGGDYRVANEDIDGFEVW